MNIPERTVRKWFMIMGHDKLFTEIKRDGYVIKKIAPNILSVVGTGVTNAEIGQWFYQSERIKDDPHNNTEITENVTEDVLQLNLF
ncbi:MAG: hypothetical protein ACRC9Z_10375 [Weissella confusa]